MSRGWFDSHCHVQDRYLEADGAPGDLPATLRRARAEGVDAMICVGTDGPASRQAIALARAARSGELGSDVPELFATAGQHPHEAAQGLDEVGALLEAAASDGDGAVVAVGECGLDYHYDHSPRQAQRAVFAEQIRLAHRFELPLVVHAREAWDDLFETLEGEGVPPGAVLHCFTGGPAELERCVEAGMMVSFSGIVTFKNAEDVRQAALACPLERLLVETDSPFLAPVPHRGQRNEPSFVPLVGHAVAELKGLTPGELATITSTNARRVFKLN